MVKCQSAPFCHLASFGGAEKRERVCGWGRADRDFRGLCFVHPEAFRGREAQRQLRVAFEEHASGMWTLTTDCLN